jgi:integrase
MIDRQCFSHPIILPEIYRTKSGKVVYPAYTQEEKALHWALDRLAGWDLPGKEHVEEYFRSMDPDDVKQFISGIDNPRDRAMIMVLLRTGMRIGELLNTKTNDLHIKDRKIDIYEGENIDDSHLIDRRLNREKPADDLDLIDHLAVLDGVGIEPVDDQIIQVPSPGAH